MALSDLKLIRRCVERAEGWSFNKLGNVKAPGLARNPIRLFSPSHLDALAAQLVRQFLASDEFGEHYLTIDEGGASLVTDKHQIDVYGSDFTETALKAIDQFYEEQ